MIRYIIDNLESSSDESDEEYRRACRRINLREIILYFKKKKIKIKNISPLSLKREKRDGVSLETTSTILRKNKVRKKKKICTQSFIFLTFPLNFNT